MPGRLLPRPDQLAPRRAGDRVHRPGLRGEGVRRRTRDFAEDAHGGRRRDRLPRRGSRSPSAATSPGFRPYDELKAGQPTTMPDDRTTGMVMNYTSGTTGQARRVCAGRSPGVDPETGGNGFGGMLFMFGLQPFDDNVHIVRLAAVPHRGARVRGLARSTSGTRVVRHGQVDAGSRCCTSSTSTRSRTRHMVPTQFVRLPRLPEEERTKYDVSSLRHMVHAAAPCPPDVKRQMIEWWGTDDRRVLRRERGRRHDRVRRASGSSTRAPSGKPWPISEIVILDDDGNELPPGEIGTVYMHMHDGQLRVLQGQGEDGEEPAGQVLHRRRRRLPRRGRLAVPLATARPT